MAGLIHLELLTDFFNKIGHVWTAPSWQGLSSRVQIGRCSHVFGL
jgi:hypothetical protein